MTLEEWKNDFKGFVNELSMPRDDYKGIMEYIDEVPNEIKWIPVSERLPKTDNNFNEPEVRVIDMFNLDEAIKHCEKVAESKEKQIKNGDWEKDSLTERNCIKCAEEHRQLAEWLLDYKQLKEQEPCEDAISRGVLISHIENQSREWGEDYDTQQILGDIEDMPSVKPQERTGHWITEDRLYPKCDQCGWEYSSSMTKFCPNCGAKMESEE